MKSEKIVALIIAAIMLFSISAAAENEAALGPDCSVEENVAIEPAAVEEEASEAVESIEQPKEESAVRIDVSDLELPETGIPIDSEYISGFKDVKTYSDEDFFGVYDKDSQKWMKPGKFNYVYNDDMAEIGEAVMEAEGDYTEVKQLYLDYNRRKVERQNREPIGSNDKLDKLKADLLMDGFGGQFTLVDTVRVPEEEGKVTLDVTSTVRGMRGKNAKLLFKLVGRRKDGSRVQLFSKENEASGNAAVLNVASNGVVKPYPTVGDTTIRAGANRTKSYGSDPYLYVCESKSSIGLRDMVDSATERTFVEFDTRDLGEEQNISEATLSFYGNNIGDAGSDAELVVFQYSNASFNENTFKWTSFAHRVFSSYGDRNLSWVLPSANANPSPFGGGYREDIANEICEPLISQWQHTGNEAYAYHAIVDILGYTTGRGANQYDISSLRCGVRGQKFHRFVFRLLDSRFMTPTIFTHMMKFYYRQGYDLFLDWKQQIQRSNWGVTQTSGLYLVMMNMPEIAEYDKWKSTADYRFRFILNECIYSDGACSEVPISYTSYSLNGLSLTKEYAEELNETVPFPDEINEGMVKLALYIARMTGPNFVDPQQGNCYNYYGSYRSHIERVYKYLPDNPYLEYIATNGERGLPFEDTSVCYPVSKKIMMRSGWGDKDLYLQTNIDGAQKQHGHADDLATNIFAYGRYLLIDPRYNNYGKDDPYRIWYNSTEAHNTVVINNMTQKVFSTFSFSQANIPMSGSRGVIHDWETNNSYDFLKGETLNYKNYPAAYTKGKDQNFSHVRNILFVRPDFWIVSDYAAPAGAKSREKSNSFRQLWHVLPEANVTADQLTRENGTIIGRTNFDDVNMQVVIADDGTINPVLKDGYYGEGVNNIPVKYFSFEKNQMGAATFDTLLRPENLENQADITSAKLSLPDVENDGATAADFTISEKNGRVTDISYYIVHDSRQQALRQFGGFATDGSLAYAERTDGKKSRLILRDGIRLCEGETILIQSEKPVEDLSVQYNGETVSLSSQDTDFDERAVTVYAEKPPKEVTVNGESVPFQTSGCYLYFGDEPIIGGQPKPSPSVPAPTSRPHGETGGGKTGGSVPSVSMPTPTMVPTPAPGVEQPVFLDIEGHWAAEAIESLSEAGLVKGVTEERFAPEQTISRAEFAAMVVRALGLPAEEYSGSFVDVNEYDWFASEVQAAFQAGLITGSDNAFRPNDCITREEAVKILVAAFVTDEIEQKKDLMFADREQISEWAKEAIEAAYSLGLVNGNEAGAFDPKQELTRAEGAAMLYRARNLK